MNVRNALLMLLVFFLGACVRVGHIQQQQPFRQAGFAGDHKTVAQCVQRRLGGRVQEEGFGERYVVYDSAKGRSDMTHWAMTVSKLSAGQGMVEWRATRPQQTRSIGSAPGGGAAVAGGGITEETIVQYWNPVLDCVAQAKGS
jgi:hypothetical protein